MNRKFLQLLLLVTLPLLLSGCVDTGDSNSNVSSQDSAALIEVSSYRDIDQALLSGPVLVEMGYDGCPACVAQEPIMEEIAADYQGEAEVLYIDTRNAGPLARQFGVDYVPDSFVIVEGEDGQYVYMKADGQTTSDRNDARFVGLTGKDKLTSILDYAIEARQKSVDTAEAHEEAGLAESRENAGMIEITSFEEINQTLVTGPVLIEVGSESCSACNAQKPIMEEIAAEYPQATIAYVDNRRGNELAVWFGASYVPDSFVIVDIEDGQYVYMGLDGETTTERTAARFLGLTKKDLLTETLENAIEVRQGS